MEQDGVFGVGKLPKIPAGKPVNLVREHPKTHFKCRNYGEFNKKKGWKTN